MFAGYEHLLGGLAGGVASTLACHPFDLLKIRYSANEGNPLRPQYRSYWHAANSIVRTNGFRALYQGLTPAIIAAPLSWGLYFHLFHRVRTALDEVDVWRNGIGKYSLPSGLVVGCVAGGLVLSITNPLWLCKTRLCLQYEHSAETGRRYAGLWDCLTRTRREEGFRGYYRGFVPGLIGTTNGSIQFALYNWMKEARCKQLGFDDDSKLNTADYLLYSTLSKVCSTVLTFPYQVLRTRLQDQHASYTGVVNCITRTVKGEGISGLYKGAMPAILKQLPNSVVTYVVYEHTRHFLEAKGHE